MKRNLYLSIICLFTTVFAIQSQLKAQIYKFKKYGMPEGICHPFVYNISQDKNGYLWIGTGEGLCRFDGYEFNSEISSSLTDSYASASFKDKNDNLWFGHNDGTISLFNGKMFSTIVPDTTIHSTINGIAQDEEGRLFFASQNNGIIMLGDNYNPHFFKESFKNVLISSIYYVGNSYFLVGGFDGLSVYQYKHDAATFLKVASITEVPMTRILSITLGKNNNIYVGTEDEGFYLLTKKSSDNNTQFNVFNLGKEYGLEWETIEMVFEDENLNIWVATNGKGIYRIVRSPRKGEPYYIINYTEGNGLGSKFVKTVFQDLEGNIWVGTYGKGLARLLNESFVFESFTDKSFGKSILSVCADNEYYYMGGENGIAKVDYDSEKEQYFTTANGLPQDDITALFIDEQGVLWIGTRRNGIYKMNQNGVIQLFQKKQNSLENAITSIVGINNVIWVSTKGGIFEFDQNTGITKHSSTNTGLPHNDIRQLFIDSKENVWVATQNNGIFAINNEKIYKVVGKSELEFTSITEDLQGNLWAGTYGAGIFKFTNDSLYVFSSDEGLRSNYIYSIIIDNKGSIWAGHRLGLSKIESESEVVKAYGASNGITGDCNQGAVVKDANGLIFFGTTEGLIRYDYTKDKIINVPPSLNVTSVKVSDKEVFFFNGIELPYGIYKLRIDYIGLHYNAPEEVNYQYKLEGYDLDWSDVTNSRFALYPRIEDGDYTFKLRACTKDGVCTTKDLSIPLSVSLPFWKRWWFILFSVVVIVLLIYLYIKQRERNQKHLQEYLENELDARTKEVVEQKEELEHKNRDITDSINYAQRIQTSILPSQMALAKEFSGAFIYYAPRDIVSGDFFWFDKVTEDEVIVVCADSTGHGVPGAFMSLIGATLIKDITLKRKIHNPQDILLNLNDDLHQTLTENTDMGQSTDGMDMVVVKINTKTNVAVFASAMRPYVLVKDCEQIYMKGSKATVGGNYNEEKIYDSQEVQLNKGDMIYMFSDGYIDQFGGPLGKKFKMSRLKTLISKIMKLPIEEQSIAVSQGFTDWKGKSQQIDDVIFMGIQI